MTTIIQEKPKSRASSGAASARRSSRQYILLGPTTEATATADLVAYLTTNSLLILDGLVLDAPDVSEVYPGIWDATVTWITQTRKDQKEEQNQENEVGDVIVSFDTTGGTEHITQDYGTEIYGDDAPDNHGGIGVTADGVEGVAVPAPALSWAEEHTFERDDITSEYVKTVARMTGKVNDDTFRSYAAGEVRFLGATGQRRNDKFILTFKFEASENAEGLTVGGITGIDKPGWDYLWTRYKPVVDETAKAMTREPLGVYVSKVSRSADFSLLGIGEADLEP